MLAAPGFGRPFHGRRTLRFFVSERSPIHSAHVGQELEVHYRWRPYFRYKVIVRRVERRADGLFYLVKGPFGSMISIAGWTLDPAICAGMNFGSPQADLAALVEFKKRGREYGAFHFTSWDPR